MINSGDTIAAISTPKGTGGVAVIRISGPEAVDIVNKAWKGADLRSVKSHTVHLGKFYSIQGSLLDEAVATVYFSPRSFTGENIVELGIHGSPWIQREILHDLVKRGARVADPGEFTRRAFLNGKLDLAQAEGVADLISSSSKAAHDLALTQTKGTFSQEFNSLRDKLIEFASLLELELDFSEEDVEFADRSQLVTLCNEILSRVDKLASSYSKGNVLKNGVPVVIAGVPNAGKSSLLNLLLEDNKAIVTDIPGTTRDLIEDTIELEGVLYRFIDTAGLRDTQDEVEGIGVTRAKEALEKAYIIIWVIDTTGPLDAQKWELNKFTAAHPKKKIILLLNKSDLTDNYKIPSIGELNLEPINFSTKTKEGLKELLVRLHDYSVAGENPESDIILTNARHYEALLKASQALRRALSSLTPPTYCQGKEGTFLSEEMEKNLIPVDFIAQDIREAISHLSSITGEITTTHLLHSIFSRFCIGK